MRHSIDLTYRPHSYFWAEELGVHLSSHIKGAERKAVYEALIASGRAEEADEILTSHALSEEDRAAFGRLHPSFMGGEYLPNRQSQEVEIARITIPIGGRDASRGHR